MLDEPYQSMAANAICHAANMAGELWQQAASEHMRPFYLLKPEMSQDGNQWCFLYGKDLQNGVAGFGDTPADAAYDFDKQWNSRKLLTPQNGEVKS